MNLFSLFNRPPWNRTDPNIATAPPVIKRFSMLHKSHAAICTRCEFFQPMNEERHCQVCSGGRLITAVDWAMLQQPKKQTSPAQMAVIRKMRKDEQTLNILTECRQRA